MDEISPRMSVVQYQNEIFHFITTLLELLSSCPALQLHPYSAIDEISRNNVFVSQ